jgi:hypothetical protein
MGIAGKSFRAVALLFLLLVGWIVIGVLHFVIINYKVPVQPLGDGRITTRMWDMGYVSANGTWTIDGQKHAFPINMSKIICSKQDSYCYSGEARITDNYLGAYLEFYKITKWDDATLEFISDADCVSYVYVINRSTKKLIGRQVKKTATDNSLCEIASPDLKLSFVSGWDVDQKLRSEYAPNLTESESRG